MSKVNNRIAMGVMSIVFAVIIIAVFGTNALSLLLVALWVIYGLLCFKAAYRMKQR